MPRDIQVFIERAVNNRWELILPMLKNNFYDFNDAKNNRLNDHMYIEEFYPQSIYNDYNSSVWMLLGVEGVLSKGRGIPGDCCGKIKNYHDSFGVEAFGEHWIDCDEYLNNVASDGGKSQAALDLAERITRLGDPKEMRLILWFSQ